MTTGQKGRRSVVLRAVLLFAMVAGTLTALSAVSAPASADSYNVMIKNYATGDCLFRAAKHERVHLAPCSGGPDERWGSRCSYLTCFDLQFYNLVNGNCLTGAGPDTDTYVGLYACSSLSPRDKWWAQVSSTLQAFRFSNYYYANQCLDQLNNIAVLAPCSASTSQFWTIVYP